MVSARFISCMVALLWLGACGGGGGGGNSGKPPVSIAFSASELSFQAESIYSGIPASQTISATLSGSAPQSALYIRVEVANPNVVTVNDVRVTGETGGQATVVPALPATLGAGEHTTTITVRACLDSPNCASGEITGSPKTIAVRYTVPSNVRGDNVSPNVVAAEASGEVILRGRNFSQSTAVTIAGTAATSRFVSSSELRVQYPALPAGRYPILLDSGAVAFTGELIVAQIPAFAGATLPLPGFGHPFDSVWPKTILYDAQRQAILLLYWPVRDNAPLELTRFAYSSGTWMQGPVVTIDAIARQIALSPDGSRVLMLAQRGETRGTNQMIEIDPETLQVLRSTDLQLPGDARSFAIMNDGNALITSNIPGSGQDIPQLYALQTRTLVTTYSYATDAPVVGSSDDGSVAFLLEASLIFDTSTGLFTRVSPTLAGDFPRQDWWINPLPPSFSRDGAKMLMGLAIVSRQGQTLGSLDRAPDHLTGVISKRGTRVYTIDSANRVHTYDVSGTPTNGRYPEIGSPVELPDGATDLGDAWRVTIAPDDRTLFIASEFGVRVEPAPNP